MKIFKDTELYELANIVKNDGVIAVPTDTIFGFCARINSLVAFEKLQKMKNRPKHKYFPVMCKNYKQIEEIAYINDNARKIINAFMPGPITVLLNTKKEILKDSINNGIIESDKIAIRMATSDTLKALIKLIGTPVLMTSVNISGEEPLNDIVKIANKFPNLDGILEGSISYGESSTIVDCTKENIVIQREGPIKLEEIEKVLNGKE